MLLFQIHGFILASLIYFYAVLLVSCYVLNPCFFTIEILCHEFVNIFFVIMLVLLLLLLPPLKYTLQPSFCSFHSIFLLFKCVYN